MDMLSVSGSYRVFGCLALFHIIMALLTIKIETSQSFRARCHNHFWPIKIIVVIGLILGSFFIEIDADIERPIMYIGLGGTGFILKIRKVLDGNPKICRFLWVPVRFFGSFGMFRSIFRLLGKYKCK